MPCNGTKKRQRRPHENHYMESNILIDMYVKCGSVLEDARRVFNRIMSPSSIFWSDMILGYVKMCAECGSIEDPWRVLTKMVTQ